MNITFNESDQNYLDKALKKYSANFRISIDLEYLLAEYQDFVTSVEDGYWFDSINYDNDLFIRSTLNMIRDGLSEDGQKKFDHYIGPIDDRFLKATTPIPRPLAGNFKEDIWWFYRIPRILLKQLKESLIDTGIIDP